MYGIMLREASAYFTFHIYFGTRWNKNQILCKVLLVSVRMYVSIKVQMNKKFEKMLQSCLLNSMLFKFKRNRRWIPLPSDYEYHIVFFFQLLSEIVEIYEQKDFWFVNQLRPADRNGAPICTNVFIINSSFIIITVVLHHQAL